MLKKTIRYTDYNGVEQTEDFYFNLSTAELTELELTSNGGMKDYLTTIAESGDGRKIIDEFKRIIFLAYGQRSEDGRRFIKSPQLSEEFSQTEAYSSLFMELVTNAVAAAEFVKGLVPAAASQPQDFNRPQPAPVTNAQIVELPSTPGRNVFERNDEPNSAMTPSQGLDEIEQYLPPHLRAQLQAERDELRNRTLNEQ